MCGILAGISPIWIRSERIRSALQALRHRGPDQSGIFAEGGAFLGIRRLAIIDVAGGKQPVSNETGSVTAVLNGEIYNFQELSAILQQRGHSFVSRSDTEVLVHAYEEWGPTFVEKLRGMFAFAIWDKNEERLVVARDRFGKKPLYYRQLDEGGMVFASELKALRALVPEERWAIRPQSVYDYLSILSVPQPNTIYENVMMLPEGSVAVVQNGRFQISRFWELPLAEAQPWNYEDAKQAVREQIRQAVRVRLVSDVPLGVFLSGGLDSTIVAYEAAQVLGGDLRTFTVAMDDSVLNEAPIAARTARALGVQNDFIQLDVDPANLLEKVVEHYDQPFADASAIPSYAVARKAREFVTVVLNGDGGDEVFGGYRRYVAAAILDRIPFMQTAARLGLGTLVHALARDRRGLAGFIDRLLRGLRSGPGEKYLTWTTDALLERDKRTLWAGAPMRSTESWIETLLPKGKSALRTQMLGDQKIILPGLLVKMDMATMLASVEARSPFLDHTLAELAATLPDRFLVHGTTPKAILRDAYAEVLPKEVLEGKKRGFEVPLQKWLANDWREMIHDLLGAPNARVFEFIERKPLEAILRSDVLNERNRSYILYSFLVLELWLRASYSALEVAELAEVP